MLLLKSEHWFGRLLRSFFSLNTFGLLQFSKRQRSTFNFVPCSCVVVFLSVRRFSLTHFFSSTSPFTHFGSFTFVCNFCFVTMKASCFIFSYLKLYTTMPIAKLAAFLDMVRKPEVSFQFQTRKLFLSGSVNKLRFRVFTQNLPARSVELRSASGLSKRSLCQFCRTDH